MAICSLGQSFIHLRRVLHRAKLAAASVAAVRSLTRAQRFAFVQVIGVSFSLVLTILALPAAVLTSFGHDLMGYDGAPIRDSRLVVPVSWGGLLVQLVDSLGNAVAVLLLSGSHRLHEEDSQPSQNLQGISGCNCPAQPRAIPAQKREWSPGWKAKVEELSLRGMTLRSLFHFYQESLPSIPDWRYVPEDHKTRDVVRRAIIPLTSGEECSYAASTLNRDGPQRAQVMVTHNWANNFYRPARCCHIRCFARLHLQAGSAAPKARLHIRS